MSYKFKIVPGAAKSAAKVSGRIAAAAEKAPAAAKPETAAKSVAGKI